MEPAPALAPDPALERVVEKISTEYGFDIRSYKRSTLYRRIRKRMADVGCAEVRDYAVLLDSVRSEYEQLLDTILINVTEFFRDPEAWDYLHAECLGPLVRQKSPGEQIRAWCVGCATGEEAYSLAICLDELIGGPYGPGFKIYATDVDEAALAVARPAVYGPDSLRNMSAGHLRQYFEPASGGRFCVKPELRSRVVFGRQNVLTDPPISRLDILICRNLLIYFDADAQHHILSRFHYALLEGGCLFLGKAETLMTRSHLFAPAEPRFRIFRRLPAACLPEAVLSVLDARPPARS